MTINGIDISVYGATLLGKQIGNHEVVQVYDWLEGASAPVYLRTQQRFKTINLSLLLESATEAQTEQYFISLMQASRNSTIQFDDLDKRFACHFEGAAEPQRIALGVWIVELELSCYRTFLPDITESATGALSKTIANTGTVPSGCIVTVTPTLAIAEYTITGLSSTPIKIKNLSANKPHVIDGVTYRYLKDGANDIGNYSAFEWPMLKPGSSTITFSHSTVTVLIQYAPAFP